MFSAGQEHSGFLELDDLPGAAEKNAVIAKRKKNSRVMDLNIEPKLPLTFYKPMVQPLVGHSMKHSHIVSQQLHFKVLFRRRRRKRSPLWRL